MSYPSFCNARAVQKCKSWTLGIWEWLCSAEGIKKVYFFYFNRNKNAFNWPQEGARESLWQSPDNLQSLQKPFVLFFNHTECHYTTREQNVKVSSVLKCSLINPGCTEMVDMTQCLFTLVHASKLAHNKCLLYYCLFMFLWLCYFVNSFDFQAHSLWRDALGWLLESVQPLLP